MSKFASLASILIAMAVALFVIDGSITSSPNTRDARQNLQYSFNLANAIRSWSHADSSIGGNESSGNYREPLPVFLLALHILIHPTLADIGSIDELNSGDAVISLKRHHLIWAGLLMIGAVLLVIKFGGTGLLGIGGSVVAIAFLTVDFLVRSGVVDRFYTEIQAATLLMWLTYSLVLAVKTRHWKWFVFTGLLTGALALTKSVFLYIGIAIPMAMLVVCLLSPAQWSLRASAPRFAVMAMCTIAVVAPWIAHNYIKYGVPTLSQRGGEILMMRVYNNTMTDDEARGALYVWGPNNFRHIIGDYLGFSPRDLSKGGRLQRLNLDGDKAFVDEDWAAEVAGRPEDALTYYTAARAERVKLHRMLQGKGRENLHQLIDLKLRARALATIRSDIYNHLSKTPLFLWRGLWTRSPPNYVQLIAYLSMVFGFFGVMIAGLLFRNPVIAAATVPTAGAVLFYALFTQFHPRFGDILVPAIYAATITGCVFVLRKLWVHLFRRNA